MAVEVRRISPPGVSLKVALLLHAGACPASSRRQLCRAVTRALGAIASTAAHKNISLAHHLYQLCTPRLPHTSPLSSPLPSHPPRLDMLLK
ncbi:hypothetical protein E2C01_069137 [Portunus trituberculatus]|uniref:Uncharacterized protein n=1 Tax=Portunus trituberculatus TaxID=210409 RepID=A0A5B7HTU0_PORTR|nr:hypothetical protein [Portunus trituberculatus]